LKPARPRLASDTDENLFMFAGAMAGGWRTASFPSEGMTGGFVTAWQPHIRQ